MKTMNVPNVVFRNIAAHPMPRTSIAFVYGTAASPSARLLIRHMERHALRDSGSGAVRRSVGRARQKGVPRLVLSRA
jgi:hypothetical protein